MSSFGGGEKVPHYRIEKCAYQTRRSCNRCRARDSLTGNIGLSLWRTGGKAS